MIRLQLITGQAPARLWQAPGDSVVRVGPAADNDLTVGERSLYQNFYATIERLSNGRYLVYFSGMAEVVAVQRTPLPEFRGRLDFMLSPGDTITLGDTEIRLLGGHPHVVFLDEEDREVPMDGPTLAIGRRTDNDLVLDDPLASGSHARIECHESGFVIRDLGSTNGTRVNGQRITEAWLSETDVIQIGETRLRFLVERSLNEEQHAAGVHADGTDDADQCLYLVFVSGPHVGESLAVGSRMVTIGDHRGCSFVIRDPEVRGLHLSMMRVDDSRHPFLLRVESSGSRVRVNGMLCVGEARLGISDVVEFGRSTAEMRIFGNAEVKQETVITMMGTLMGGVKTSALEIAMLPKFVIGGEIERAESMTIGSAPRATIQCEGPGMAPVHCEIAWQRGGFHVRDRSRSGTYVNGQRTVELALEAGVKYVLQVSENVFDVTVRGDYCTIETVDTAAAMAAVQVARETAFNMAAAVVDQANSTFGAHGKAYTSKFNIQNLDVSSLVRERKAKLEKGAPAWRASSDITGQRSSLFALLSAAAAALIMAVIMHTSSSDAALNNQPLSEAHASRAFTEMARDNGQSNVCQACHTLGDGVTAARCTEACHQPFADKLRPSHAEYLGAAYTCASCHTEHVGAKRSPENGRAGARCEGCHPGQHEDALTGAGPITVAADASSLEHDLDLEALHVVHARLDGGARDVPGLGCNACHAAVVASTDAGADADTDDPSAAPAMEPSPAGLSCLRCHGAGGATGTDAVASAVASVREGCTDCHGSEHQGVTLERLPTDDEGLEQAIAVPATGSALSLAGFLALVAMLPLLGLGVVRLVMRKRLQRRFLDEVQAFPVELAKQLVHSINVEKCVGCQLCVKACPADVLELVNHKSVVVNFDACIQCRRCEDACAFDALRMHDADQPPPMVAMPQVDANYMTPVDGLYLIGQAAGTPQIKNAANLGHAAVGHILANGLQASMGRALGAQLDVIIVGSGPAGLSAAVSCARASLSYTVLEKQRQFSWTVRNYYHKGKPVMAEPNDVNLVSHLPHFDGTREQILEAWQGVIAEHRLDIRYEQNVTNIERKGEIFHVTVSDSKGEAKATYTAARVILAIGTMGNPRRLRCPGDDMEKVHDSLVDPDDYRNQNILVVGGTDSAAEVALALCQHNRVWLSCRSPSFTRIKPKNLQLMEQAMQGGAITPLWSTTVSEVRDGQVTLTYRDDSREEVLQNDHVFAMIGGSPPVKWLQSIGVPYVDKPHSWSPPRTDELAMRHS